ncbi:protein DBF4 homolog A [Mixophyes fleayi]|uniref:protein DBF4 homolog A n=1 Tax=Mixophyes fleayi TaxID=3061075 RepID=UPI003F4DB855
MKPGLPAATYQKLPDKGPAQKPFAGRVFYLDITSKLVAEKLEKDIKELGGTVEGFLSKEISYLITNKKEAKCAKSLKYMCSVPSPEPARNTGNVSAQPSGRKGECQEGGSSKKPEKGDVSRGKSLLKKVIKETKILQKNSILANAYNWGVRILHVEEAKLYIEQKKRSLPQVKQESSAKPVVKRPPRRKVKVQRLLPPFIKVEDNSCQYRPLYLLLPFFRSFQPPITKPSYSVDKPVAGAAPKETETKQSLNKTWHGQDGKNAHFKVKEEKPGYCECCLLKFDDLDAHLVTQQHKTYSQGPCYQDVDNLISSFEFDFVDWSLFRQEAKRSETLPAPNQHEQEGIPQINSNISQIMSYDKNLESEVGKETELKAPQDATCSLLNNTVCPEPVSSHPSPVQPLPLTTCLTDSSYKQPCSQVITPINETVPSPTLMDETGDVLNVYNKDCSQKDMHTQESNTQRLNDPPEAAKDIQNCFSEPVSGCPSKKVKLDDSLDLQLVCSRTLDADLVTALLPSGDLQCTEEMGKSCPSKLFEALPNQSPHCSPSKLHRKVKQFVHKARKPEEIQCKPPLEPCELSSSKENLLLLFESSNVQSEFYGFSCNSLDNLYCMEGLEEQPSSHGNSLCSMFSHTGSSDSTFNGF